MDSPLHWSSQVVADADILVALLITTGGQYLTETVSPAKGTELANCTPDWVAVTEPSLVVGVSIRTDDGEQSSVLSDR